MSKKDTSIVIILTFIILFMCWIITMIFFTKDNVERFTIAKTNILCTYENRIIEDVPIMKEDMSELEEYVENSKNNDILEESNNIAKKENYNKETEVKVVEIKKEVPKAMKTETKTTITSESTVEKTEPKKEEIKIEAVKKAEKEDNTILSTYKGFATIGKIEIPKTGVNTYILKNMSVSGMKVAPCFLYSTGQLNISGKTLIGGHNNNDGKIFSNNNKLQNGDKIYVTTLDGKKIEYVVYKKFTTTPEDVSYLTDVSKPEIILSCCTDDDNKRLLVLAKQNK